MCLFRTRAWFVNVVEFCSLNELLKKPIVSLEPLIQFPKY